MRLLNFKVGDDFISVVKDNVYFDLHGNFDFAGYNYSVGEKEFHLIFTKSSEDWASKEVFDKLVFLFRKVAFLKIKESDSSSLTHDESCLNDIGFSATDMREDMKLFLASNEFQPDYDMIFIFQSGQVIKIHSNEVLLETI
jgi:hypothetical protein